LTGDPDLLVMTATPIPRTAAMIMFGDLDATVLDELPPGRVAIVTKWLPEESDETEAWQRVRDEVAAGHRAFVVCPLISDSEKVEARSAEAEFERLSEVGGELARLKVAVLHGQMPAAEREDVMARFRTGELEVLVATTVIEVGVDVPEATVMVIESADRFGIAQLHQLRGRVGRGTDPSWCYLLGPAAEDDPAGRRLAAVAATTDGFALAEADLELRGEGTILGVRQKGQSDLRLASLSRPEDRLLLTEARRVAEAIIKEDALLEQPEHQLLADEVKLFLSEDEADYLFKS
jgi:ATP-dependent DNA helicase RecG